MNKQYKTALLVVDMQKDFTMPWGTVYYPTTEAIIPLMAEDIEKLREKGVLIVYVYSEGPEKINGNPELTGYNGGKLNGLIEGTPGAEYDERLRYVPGTDIKWKKYAPSAFFKTNLDEVLREYGVTNVLVCGVKTNCCVRATANDANCHKFRTFMISDIVATNTVEETEIHLLEAGKYFAKPITSAEMFERIDRGEL